MKQSYRLYLAVITLAASLAVPCIAQPIGYLSNHGDAVYTPQTNGAVTIIDFSHPSDQSISVNSVTFRWVGGPAAGCAGDVKIKLFRTAGGISQTAVRGPFTAVAGMNTFALSPAFSLHIGDTLGITMTGGTTCGGVGLSTGSITNRTLIYQSDVTTESVDHAEVLRGDTVDLMAAADPFVLAAIIPAVASTEGGNGALFKTSLQLTNQTSTTINGKFVYHRQGQPSVPADPVAPFTLAPQQSIAYANILDTIGVTGLGSLDVMTNGSMSPVVTARVYNDAGDAGTSGFFESGIPPQEVPFPNSTRVVNVPVDFVNYRMNIGVRTLNPTVAANVTILVTVVNPAGASLITLTKTYPGNYFEQVPLSTFLEGFTTPFGSTLRLTFRDYAIVYAATVDNKTNDSSIAIPY